MSSFPGSPRLIKGAIVGIDPFNPVASVVVFQYNPETLTRTIALQGAGDGADRGEVLRLKGPPCGTHTTGGVPMRGMWQEEAWLTARAPPA